MSTHEACLAGAATDIARAERLLASAATRLAEAGDWARARRVVTIQSCAMEELLELDRLTSERAKPVKS